MEEKIYRYAPVLLLLAGPLLWLTAFLLSAYYSHNRGLVWVAYGIIQMAISVMGGILIGKLQREIHTDNLTGLRNRRYLYEKLPALTSKAPVSLILMDIDNFKSVNDTYGHIAGDQVLQQFADILQVNTRKTDIIARLGGEEFAVVLPQTDIKEAYKIAERIRKVVEGHSFSYKNVDCKITVSLGIAAIKECMNIDRFLEITDRALYRAKEKKNFVVTAAEG